MFVFPIAAALWFSEEVKSSLFQHPLQIRPPLLQPQRLVGTSKTQRAQSESQATEFQCLSIFSKAEAVKETFKSHSAALPEIPMRLLLLWVWA